MAEPMKVTPKILLTAAQGHTAAADYLRTVTASNDAIQQTLDSLGPVYAELREEGRLKLDERRRNYEAQAADHAKTAANLHQALANWDTHERDAAQRFGGLRA
jgi:Excreted virulence factor EspC, type VII ESX diderm